MSQARGRRALTGGDSNRMAVVWKLLHTDTNHICIYHHISMISNVELISDFNVLVLFVGQPKYVVLRSDVSSLGQSVVQTRCPVRNNFYCIPGPGDSITGIVGGEGHHYF